LETVPVHRPWATENDEEDDWGTEDFQGKIVHTKILNEDQGKLNHAPNAGGVYVVKNEEKFNAWGEPRGVSDMNDGMILISFPADYA